MNTAHANPKAWVSQRTVGRYTLLAELARGGMAELWLANQAGPGGFEKVVVVKKILPTDDESFLSMFLDEARIAAQLSHPNIVQIFELGSHEGDLFIAMEYVHGESLLKVLQRSVTAGQPVPFAYTALLVADIADGLEHAHTKTSRDGQPLTIVHRDISPQNLIVTYDGLVKVVDFGIATAAIRNTDTQHGVVKGKFGYMAPEQARGEPVDAKTDVFALGTVMFEMLTGRRRVKLQDQLKAYWELMGPQALPTPRDLVPEVPAELDAIVGRAMAKDKEKRFASMREFHAAIVGWLRTESHPVTNADIGRYMHELFADNIAARTALIDNALKHAATLAPLGRPRRETWLRVSAAVVGLLLVVFLVVAVLSRTEAPPPVVAPVVVETPAVTVEEVEPPEVSALVVETDPPGAQVVVDGTHRGVSPLTLLSLGVGPHDISTSMPGRRDAKQTVRIESEGQQLKVVLPLVEAKVPKSPRSVQAPGRLTLDTIPWTRVFSGKTLLGETPLIDVSVPSGLRRLRLVNEAKRIDQVIEVQIKPGQTTVKKLSL